MGIQHSKPPQEQSSSASVHEQGKYGSQDDMLSKTTASTVDSSAPNSPIVMTYSSHFSQKRKGTFSDSMTRASRSLRGISNSMSNRMRSPEPATRNAQVDLTQRESSHSKISNRSNRRSESLPVKLPPKSDNPYASEDDVQGEGEEVEHLTRMYDSRTWEMYRRITASRNKQPPSFAQSSAASALTNDSEEWDLNREYTPSSPRSGAELIFMFDFD